MLKLKEDAKLGGGVEEKEDEQIGRIEEGQKQKANGGCRVEGVVKWRRPPKVASRRRM